MFADDRPMPRSASLNEFVLKEVQSGRGIGRRYLPQVIANIENQVATGNPIEFAVIAIAHKNPNSAICDGRKDPDLAELGFILHLDDILNGVENYYPPGARFTILTEGHFYNLINLFDVDDQEIYEYEKKVAEMARQVSGDRINLVSLSSTLADKRSFLQKTKEVESRLRFGEYEHYIDVMRRSLTQQQISLGYAPIETAKRYVALHKAKHQCGQNGESSVYQYLEQALGPNYIYCSVTTSSRPEVLNIDPYFKPGQLPQHGLGILAGGSYKIRSEPAYSIDQLISTNDIRAINVSEYPDDGRPFGYVDFGKKRN